MAGIDGLSGADQPNGELRPPAMSHLALFARFLRFGALAFGGPVAQIAMIRRELVDEAGWIDGPSFNRLLAVLQVLPGPEAHELCVHLGIRAKGRLGGLFAGLGFMLPGLCLMLALAWAYSRIRIEGTILGACFLGVQAATLAVIVRALHRIGEHILLDRGLWLAASAAAVASHVGVSFWIILPAAGTGYALVRAKRPLLAIAALGLAALAGWFSFDPRSADAGVLGIAEAGPPTIAGLFWAGLKGGLLTFGGAYAAIPFVRTDTVGRGWMSDGQFLDGLALAGVLPAPLVIFATFVGWISGGLGGALAITAGMFLPAFAFSMIFYERLEAVSRHERLQTFLAGVAASVVGLIAATFLDLVGAAAARTPQPLWSGMIFALAVVLVYVWRSRWATPAVLALGASLGAVVFGNVSVAVWM